MDCRPLDRLVLIALLVGAGSLAACGSSDGANGTADTSTSGDTDVVIDPNNQAPTVEIQQPKADQVFQFGDPVPLVAKVNDAEDLPTELVLTIVSDINDQVGLPTANDAGFVNTSIATLSPGDHQLTLTAKDSGGKVGTATVAISINGAPLTGAVTIEPASPTTEDELTAAISTPFTDPNRASEELDISWAWYVDGGDASISLPKVPAARTTKGDSWRVLATATDPHGKTAQAEATVVIGNSAPVCGQVTVLPSLGKTDTEFTCTCSDRSDPDVGDPNEDTCAFYSGTTKLSDGCTLPATATTKGMKITCRVDPYDGEDHGVEAVSDPPITVENSAPTAPSAAIQPTAGKVETEFTCLVTQQPTDVDGDAFTLSYKWVVNGYENPGDTSDKVIPYDNLVSDADNTPVSGGDSVSCCVYAKDATHTSATCGSSALIVLGNTVPRDATVLLKPAGADENTELTCEASGGFDPDGDDISWLYRWTKNGSDISGAEAATLAPTHFTVDDEIKCYATPTDGTGNGAEAASKIFLKIQNAPPTPAVVSVHAPLDDNGSISCRVDTEPTDKEPLSLTFYWQIFDGADDVDEHGVTVADGTEFAGPQTLTADYFAPCNIIKCRLEADDNSSVTTSAVATLNLPVGTCDDGNVCTGHSCSIEGVCVTANVSGSCNDHNPCTPVDTCFEGECRGDIKDCNDNQFCTDDACNPETGACENTPHNRCKDTNACTADSCDYTANAGDGACKFEPLTLGADSCDADGSGCTAGDYCDSGECKQGGSRDCNTENDIGQCTNFWKCVSDSPTRSHCVPDHADTTKGCDDGKFCTAGDHCDGAGNCVSELAYDCSQEITECQSATCNETEDTCDVTNLGDDTPCNFDNSGCTINDTCDGSGRCEAGAPASCDHLDEACVTGRCSSIGTNGYECVADNTDENVSCEDGDLCTINTLCDGQGSCVLPDTNWRRDCQQENAPGEAPGCRPWKCDKGLGCIEDTLGENEACDDGDSCTLGDFCDFLGRCASGNDICADERISFGALSANPFPPVVQSTRNGRYVTQWRSPSQVLEFRASDALGSRESEPNAPDFIGASVYAAGADQYAMGIAGDSVDGDFVVLSLEWSGYHTCRPQLGCNPFQSATVCECLRLYSLVAYRYDATGHFMDSGKIQEFYANGYSRCIPANLATYASIFQYSDGSYGLVFAPVRKFPADNPGFGRYTMGHGVRYRRISSALVPLDTGSVPETFGDPCLETQELAMCGSYTPSNLTPATHNCGVTSLATVNATTERLWAADKLPRSDGFAMAWPAEDQKSVLATLVSRNGEKGADVTVATVEDWETVGTIKIKAFNDFSYTVFYEVSDENGTRISAVRVSIDAEVINSFDVVAAQSDVHLGGVGRFSNSDVVVTWWDEDADADGSAAVFARRFSVTGSPRADATIINRTEAGAQHDPNVTVLPNDDWVVAFRGDGRHVYTRRFEQNGDPIPGRPEIEIGKDPSGNQDEVAGAAGAPDEAVVVWTNDRQGAEGLEIFYRAFDSLGSVASDVYGVNETTAGDQSEAAIAGDQGEYIVAWTDSAQDGDGSGVYAARITSASDGGVSSEIALAVPEADCASIDVIGSVCGHQTQPRVAFGDAGAWMAAWMSEGDVVARPFDAGDVAAAVPVRLHEGSAGLAGSVDIAAALDLGAYVVAWTRPGEGTEMVPVIEARDLAGEAIGTAVELGGKLPGGGDEPANTMRTSVSVAVGSAGEGTACWETSDTHAIRCQRFTVSADTGVTAIEGTFDPARVRYTNRTPAYPIEELRNDSMSEPDVKYSRDGRLIVSWTRQGIDGDGTGVQYVRLTADGDYDGTRVLANRHWPDDQAASFVVPFDDPDQRFILGWQSNAQDGSGWGAYLRALDFVQYD